MSFDSLGVRNEGIGRRVDIDDGLTLAVGFLRGDSVAILAPWERKDVET